MEETKVLTLIAITHKDRLALEQPDERMYVVSNYKLVLYVLLSVTVTQIIGKAVISLVPFSNINAVASDSLTEDVIAFPLIVLAFTMNELDDVEEDEHTNERLTVVFSSNVPADKALADVKSKVSICVLPTGENTAPTIHVEGIPLTVSD